MSQPLEQRLKDYQRRINELQSVRSMPLEPERLRALAAEHGLSDEDLAAADDIAYASFQRGEGFLTSWDYDQALDAFADAVALRPDWLEYRAALARAYMARYEAYGRDHDRYRIIELTQDCLDVEPGYRPAVELINRLNARQEQAGQAQVDPQQYIQRDAPPPEQPAENETNGCGLLILIAVGLTMCFPCCCLGDAEEDDYDYDTVEVAVPEPVLDDELKEQLETISSARPIVDAPVTSSHPVKVDGQRDNGVYTLDTVHVETEASKDLAFEVQRSQLKIHGQDSAYYEIWLQMTNTLANEEINSLKVKVTLFDDGGDALETKETHVVLSLMSAPVRPGETFGMRQLIKTDATAKYVSFEATSITTDPAAATYAPTTPVSVRWTEKAEQGAETLTVRKRTESFYVSSRKPDEGFYKIAIEMTNSGDFPLKQVRATAHFKDASGNLLDSKGWYPVGMLKMPILSGQTHTASRTFKVPSSFKEFELEVKELEFDVQQ